MANQLSHFQNHENQNQGIFQRMDLNLKWNTSRLGVRATAHSPIRERFARLDTTSMRMFADDTKIWTRISATTDSVKLQNDLDSLTAWSSRWLLHFNPDKCKVTHIGHQYDTKYYMSDGTHRVELQPVGLKEEKDSGVTITDDLRPRTQCLLSAAKARKITGGAQKLKKT